MIKRTLLLTAIFTVAFLLTACGQGSGNSDEAQREKGALSIQAAIVYQYGGAQPVARTDFFLLDDSLESILKKAGLDKTLESIVEKAAPSVGHISLLEAYSATLKASSKAESNSEFGTRVIEVRTRAVEAIKPHIIKSTTTDFDGRAQFEPVPVGNYYVYGMTETRGGIAIWNLNTQLKSGQNQLILDQNNAATAF